MLNHICIMGRMTRDPELRRTGSGIAVTNFTVAVDRDYNPKDGAEKEVDFIDCIAWRGGAEFVSKYFSKGKMIVVSGKLRIHSWTDKDGNKRRSAEVEADSVYFGDSKKSEGTPTTYSQPSPANQEPYTEVMAYVQSLRNAQQSEFTVLEDDDAQLPF